MKENRIDYYEAKKMKKEISKFNPGDTVVVYLRIKEEGKTRIQTFEGIVIKKKGKGTKETFAVRRISYGEGVERTFLLHSPAIEKIEVKKKGAVKKSKLYYLRKKIGKKSKVEQKIEREKETSPNALPRAESS